MKKMNDKRISKKARIGIAALAAIMTLSYAAPLAANAATLKGQEATVAANADNKDEWVLLYYHDHFGDGGKTEI